ncbi:MAG: YciI family protein [Pseudoxanthomonas sp.]
MFVVLLTFSDRRDRAADFADGHDAWLRRGFDDGVFLLAGALHPAAGGAILAHAVTRQALQQRVQDDPFVANDVVSAQVLEIAARRAEPRLHFLLEQARP